MRAAFEAVRAAKIRSHATGHARHHFADAGSYMIVILCHIAASHLRTHYICSSVVWGLHVGARQDCGKSGGSRSGGRGGNKRCNKSCNRSCDRSCNPGGHGARGGWLDHANKHRW